MKRSYLGAIALGVSGAAVVGFGSAAGRDLWKSTKKAGGTLLFLACVLAAVCFPYMGGRNLVRGHEPGEGWKIILDMLLIIAGMALGIAAAMVFGMFTSGEGTTPSAILFILGGATALVIGLVVGAFQRPEVQRRITIAQRNEQFLSDIGLGETGESEITHYDREGNGLRFIERTNDSIVLMAVGKRNKRAYIGLSPDGTMTGYTGIVPTGAPRVFPSTKNAA